MLTTPFVFGGKMRTKIKNKYTNMHKKDFFKVQVSISSTSNTLYMTVKSVFM